jgi:hypothetical protein
MSATRRSGRVAERQNREKTAPPKEKSPSPTPARSRSRGASTKAKRAASPPPEPVEVKASRTSSRQREKKARITRKVEEEKQVQEEEEEIEEIVEPPRKKRAAIKQKPKKKSQAKKKREATPEEKEEEEVQEEEEDNDDDIPEVQAPAERDDDVDEDDEEEINVDDVDEFNDNDDDDDDNDNDAPRSAGQKRKAGVVIREPTNEDIRRIKAKYANDRRGVPNDARTLAKGFRHVRIARVGNTAKSLGIPYNRALVGFDKFYGRWVPIFSGVIIHNSSYNDLITGVNFKSAKQNRQFARRADAHAKLQAQADEERQRVLERQHSLEGAFSSAPFEERVRDAGLAGVSSAVRAVRVAVGKAASEMDSPAAIKAVDAAIRKVRERYDELCALALRLDVDPVPDDVDVTGVLTLDESAQPLAAALAPLCAAAVQRPKRASWRTALAARCAPVAAAIDDATAALLVKELADCEEAEIEPMFGFDATYRIAWLVGADDEGAGVALRLAKFDGTLAQRGVRGELAPFLAEERATFAAGIGAVKSRVRDEVADLTLPELRERVRAGGFGLRGATRKDDIINRLVDAEASVFDADADLDELLASDRVRGEVEGHAAIDDVLAKYFHPELRDEVVHKWHTAVNVSARDVALQAICDLRVARFDAAVRDVAVLAWDNRKSTSTIAATTRASLANINSLPATLGRKSDAVVAAIVAQAKADIAQWKTAAKGAVAGHLARKEELVRLLAVRGFKQEPHHVRVYSGYGRKEIVEIDVRRATAVEFSRRDPPAPIGVDFRGAAFHLPKGQNSVQNGAPSGFTAHAKFGRADFEAAFVPDTDTSVVWRLQTLGTSSAALLRWPPRLCKQDEALLAKAITGNAAVPVRVPPLIEQRAARRATLVAAIRAVGHPEQRMPMSVDKNIMRAAHTFLAAEHCWPRSRAATSALVGNVPLACARGDIFAALPQLVVAQICERLALTHDRNDYAALLSASDAFALAAAIWEIGDPEKAQQLSSQVYRFY